MHRSFVLFGILAVSCSTGAFAQAGAPQGAVDINNSDMGPHDRATQPSNLDMIKNGIRSNDMDRTAAALRNKLGPARPAKSGELTSGAPVNDNTGEAMATIVSVDPDGVVVSTGTQKVKVPADAFGHNKAGLLLDMSKADFLKLVAKASGAS
jgi:hypothetical protein